MKHCSCCFGLEIKSMLTACPWRDGNIANCVYSSRGIRLLVCNIRELLNPLGIRRWELMGDKAMPTASPSNTREVTVLHFAKAITLFKLASFVFFIAPPPLSFYRLIDWFTSHKVFRKSYSYIKIIIFTSVKNEFGSFVACFLSHAFPARMDDMVECLLLIRQRRGLCR